MIYNTRIAPSPTGDMHLGTARTAYFNWLAARATGGKFLLRIDDTDQDRNSTVFDHDILRIMDWLGLDFDIFIRQSYRLTRYKKVTEKIKTTTAPNGAIIFIPKDIPETWDDEITGAIPISENDIELMQNGIVLMKGDGFPTYHWANVVDDIDYKINYVIRGHDHITNTSRQLVLYRALNADVPKFAHVGLIYHLNKKLSKRDGAASMLSYKEAGYHPEAVLNFMARLGWGPKVDDKSTKLLPREQMLKLFLTGGKMKNSPANIDMKKLDSFDRKYKAREKKVE